MSRLSRQRRFPVVSVAHQGTCTLNWLIPFIYTFDFNSSQLGFEVWPIHWLSVTVASTFQNFVSLVFRHRRVVATISFTLSYANAGHLTVAKYTNLRTRYPNWSNAARIIVTTTGGRDNCTVPSWEEFYHLLFFKIINKNLIVVIEKFTYVWTKTIIFLGSRNIFCGAD